MTADRDVPFSCEIFGRRASLKALCFLTSFGLFTLATMTMALPVSREQDIVDLKLGQRVKVDDGTCPAGQIKEVSGTKMTTTGVVRARKCVPRLGPKQNERSLRPP
jgi:hypothetical protein